MVKDQIIDKMKEAMKAKEKVALDTLRSLKTALSNAETAKGAKAIDEAKELEIVSKQIKQRKETAEIFEAQGRQDLADNELAQVKVLEQFMPEQMSEEDAEKIIDEIITETGASTMKDMGRVMGVASKKMAGQIDNKTISTIVKKRLS